MEVSVTDMLPEQHHGLTKSDPLWFKRAVFYEVLVRSFKDSNADGIGDLQGLTEKLDYLEWLGVDCLWLPPFYPSPLRDGGYDISHYTEVMPEIGTVGSRRPVRRFLRLVRHRRQVRRRADHLRRHRAVELDLGPGPRPVLLAPVLLQPARPELREPRRRRRDDRGAEVLAGPRRRRVPAGRRPVPVRVRRDELREPPPHPRVPEAGPQGGGRELRGPRPALRGEPVAGRRRRVL